MRILFITDFIPFPPTSGGTWRVYGLVSHLCRHADVVLLAPIRRETDDEGIAHLRDIGIQVEGVARPPGANKGRAVLSRLKAFFGPLPVHWVMTWDDAIARAISEAIVKHAPDVIHVEHLAMCRFFSSFAVGKPMVLGEQNVESVLERDVALAMGNTPAGWLRRREARKVPSIEADMISRMDMTVAVSDVDRAEYLAMSPGANVITVPNGVDVTYFTPAPPASSHTVVLTGTLHYPPNVDAAVELATEVFPRVRKVVSDARLKIVGRSPLQTVLDLAGDGVEVIPDVPDIRPYIRDAAVIAVPVRAGSGTRIKILEAMAVGKAIVSTSRGAEGLEVRDGYDILIRDDAAAFADAVAELLISSETRERVGANARRTVEEKYDYEVLARKLEQAYRSVVPAAKENARS